MKAKYDVIVVGGGAAGFFTALNIKQSKPNTEVLILERTKEVLSKVRVSEEEGVMLLMLNLYLQN